jgi:precorrin-2 dehydrogenase/sirohydrochlorin ferrochelatase
MDGPVVIFGGGEVGKRKVDYISKFTKEIIVIDEEGLDLPEHVEFKQTTVTEENFKSLIPGTASLVIAALSNEALNRAIAGWCTEQGILVNVVDIPEPSTVFFPALSKSGDVTVAISTGGKCPFLARKVREETDSWVGEKEVWLDILAPIRESLVGIDEKNRVLEEVYKDPKIRDLIVEGKIEEAKQRAWEVYKNVCG